MKRLVVLLCVGALCVALVGCRPRISGEVQTTTTQSSGTVDTTTASKPSSNTTAATGATVITGATAPVDPDDQFSKRDEETPYEESKTIDILLNGTSAKASSSLVDVSGTTVTILGEGVFSFSGTLTDGRIVVNASKDAKPQLIFNGVAINNSHGCALYVKQADKVFVTLAEGTQNTLSNSGDYVQVDDNNIDAVLFSKEDITLNGNGALTVTAKYGHGVVSKDDLVIGSGTYTVDAAAHGLCGKDCIKIANGKLTVRSGKDGVHAENNDDSTLGYLYIENGTFDIEAENDGLSASSLLQIEGGTFTVKTGGGSQNSSSDSSGRYPSWGYWGDTASQDSTSAKGIKASGEIVINGGKFTIDSSDDALHCNASMTVNGGTFTVSSGDDGMHADDDLLIAGGTIDIQKSYEGVEAQRVEVSGGTVSVVASDDGFNSAGGNDGSSAGGRPGQNSFGGNAAATLAFSGGTVYVNAAGDGLDSNGTLTVSGGTVYVSGPTNSGNAALDYDGSASACGGTVVATGSSGMAQNFSNSSTQGSILYVFSSSQAAKTVITLKDSNGTVLVSYVPEKTFQSVVITSPALKAGETYTLCYGSQSADIPLSSLLYSNSQGGGFGGGGHRPGGFW